MKRAATILLVAALLAGCVPTIAPLETGAIGKPAINLPMTGGAR